MGPVSSYVGYIPHAIHRCERTKDRCKQSYKCEKGTPNDLACQPRHQFPWPPPVGQHGPNADVITVESVGDQVSNNPVKPVKIGPIMVFTLFPKDISPRPDITAPQAG